MAYIIKPHLIQDGRIGSTFAYKDRLEFELNTLGVGLLYVRRSLTSTTIDYVYLPRERATARKGISSIGVDRRTGPWWPSLGRFQTTRGTPDLFTTLPPDCSILCFSSLPSGLWSLVNTFAFHSFTPL